MSSDSDRYDRSARPGVRRGVPRLAIVVGVGLVAAAGVVLLPRLIRNLPESNAASADPDQTQQPESRKFEWIKGATSHYQYVLKSTTSLGNGQATMTDPAWSDVEFEGEYHLAATAIEPNHVWLVAWFTNVVVRLGNEQRPDVKAMVEQSPMALRLSHKGRVLEQVLPDGLPSSEARLLRTLSALEFTLPDRQPVNQRWQAEETIDGMRTLTLYQAVPPNQLIKQKAMLMDPTVAVQIRYVESRWVATLGGRWLATLEGKDVIAFGLEEAPMGTSTMTLTLQSLGSRDTQSPLSLSLDAEQLRNAVRSQRPPLPDQRPKIPPALAASTFSQLLARLGQAVSSPDSGTETVKLKNQIRDWLSVYPERCSELVTAIKDVKVDADVGGSLISILGEAAADLPQAQDALAVVLTGIRELNPGVRVQAVISAGFGGAFKGVHLGPAIERVAFGDRGDLEPSVQRNALLSLGTLAKDNPSLKPMLVARLLPRLAGQPRNRSDSEAARAGFYALMNGKIDSAPVVNEALRHLNETADPGVKEAAIDYLGSLGNHSERLRLALADRKQPDLAVRAVRALAVAAEPDIDTVDALISLSREANAPEQTRAAAIVGLGRHRRAYPEILTMLAELRESPSSELIGQAVDTALKAMATSAPQ